MTELTPGFLPGDLMERGTWWTIVHSVAESWTQLKQLHTHTHTHTQLISCLCGLEINPLLVALFANIFSSLCMLSFCLAMVSFFGQKFLKVLGPIC